VKHVIRDHFKPFQPSIAFSGEQAVKYEEVNPAAPLRDYIYCYWRLYTPKPMPSPFTYRVVSDGCIDILFEQSASESIFATGFSTQYLEYELGQTFDYLGVRFLPTGFPALFDHDARTLTNTFLPLSDVIPDLNISLVHSLAGSLDLIGATDMFNDVFHNHLIHREQQPEVDPRLLNAMSEILASGGKIPLSQLDVGVSERQLRRLFEFYFGESPKTFARIIRFLNILGAKPSNESLKNNKIFYDEGYYDQAHFIKEFKAFYGVTPNKAFGR
jgi:AraC-like DNA-binding protein